MKNRDEAVRRKGAVKKGHGPFLLIVSKNLSTLSIGTGTTEQGCLHGMNTPAIRSQHPELKSREFEHFAPARQTS